MTDTKTQAAEGEAMSASDAEVRAILEARYPNDRRLQRAIIRLAELRPQGRYTSKLDGTDPGFQRIVPVAGTEEAPDLDVLDGKGTGMETPPKAGPLALKAEPLVTTASAAAGRPKAPGTATGPKAK